MSERILLAVDETQASQRSVEYVSAMVAGRPDQHLHMVHVVPPTAGEDPAESRPVDTQTWEMLGTLRQQLVASGIQEDHVDVGVLTVGSRGDLVEGLLDAAREQQCGTIVVGRSSLPWFREPFHDHPADELIKKAPGFTIWVVE